MCVPLAAAAMIPAAISAFGAIRGGAATQAADNYQSQAGITQAQSAQTAARINEQETYRQGDQLAGRAQAAQSANGVLTTSGSALGTRTDIADQTQRNVGDQTYNAQLATWGALNDSSLLKAEGNQAVQGSYITAGSTLLGSAAQVASKWNFGDDWSPPKDAGASIGAGSPAGWGSAGGGQSWAGATGGWGTG